MEDNWRPLEGAGRVTRVREGSDGMVDGESLPDLDDAGHKRGGGGCGREPVVGAACS